MHSLGIVQWNSTRRDHPGNPGGVSGSGPVNLPDCICLEELADLFINRLLSFWGKTPSLLFDWFKGWIDVQPVGDHCKVNSAHVFLLPGEDLHVLL